MTRKNLRWPVLAAAISICGIGAPALAGQDSRNNGNHYGWQRGVGNPHRYVDDRGDERWLISHLNSPESRRLSAEAQRRHREWHRTHPNDHRNDTAWDRAHERFHDQLSRTSRTSHRRYYRRTDSRMSEDMRRVIDQLNEKHERWHRNNDDRDDRRYEADHRALHRSLDAYYAKMRREYGR